mgnify:FL=1
MPIHKHDNQDLLNSFVVAPKIKIGTFTSPLGAGNFTINGLGFQPTMLQVLLLPLNSVIVTVNGLGIATLTDQFGTYINVGQTSTNTTKIIAYQNDLSVDQVVATLNSFDADGFTLNFTVAVLERLFGYIAFSV